MNIKNLGIEKAFVLACQNHKKNNFKVAEKLYKEILKINSNHFQTVYLLGTLSLQTKNLREAKQLFDKVLIINPNHAPALNNLELVFKELGEPQKALSCFQKAIEIQPNYGPTHNNLGQLFIEFKEFQKALNHCQKAIEIQPNHAPTHNMLGIVFKELEMPQKALDCFQKAIEIQPNFAPAHNNLGLIFHELGEPQKAIKCYQKTIEIQPNYAPAHNNLGIEFRQLGEREKAISCYKKALEIEPNSIAAQTNISNIYTSQLDNLEKAISESYKTLKMHGEEYDSTKFIDQKISLYRLKHDVQQAEYLSLKNYKINGAEQFQKIANKILSRKENRENDDISNQKILLNNNEINSLLPFYKTHYIYQTTEISTGCINPQKNWQDVEEQYFNSPKQIIYIDNLLSDEAIKELREFCLVSKIWNREYPNKYLGAFSHNGFISPIHLKIAIELKQKLPKLFGKHNLDKFWAFKYDSTLGKGIGIHADFALVNLNFWITPDEYNNDNNSGGLKVYDVASPEDWTFHKYNRHNKEIYKFLSDKKANCINIPYKFNRAVLFNSAYFHETDKINFKDKYEARRINITYLFGTRLIKKSTN